VSLTISWLLILAFTIAPSIADTGLAPDQAGDNASVSLPDDAAQEHKHKRDKRDEAAQPSETNLNSETNIAPCISWINPIVKPRVILLCIHGLGLYSGSYKDFGMIMSKRGIAVYAIDVRGFGSWMKSGGKEEVDFTGCLSDIASAIQSIKAAMPGLPLFLLGESMGGAIALRFASEHPDMIDGLISSVPAGDRFQQKKTDLKVAMELLKGPNRQFDIGDRIVAQATQNTRLREDWSSDPLDRMVLSANDLLHFQKFMNENHEAAKSITTMPVLFVQGTRDRLVKPEGTWELFNQLNTENKVFLAVPSEHLIFEETQDDNSEVKLKNFRLLSAWLFTQAKVETRVADSTQSTDLVRSINQIVAGNYTEAKTLLENLTKVQPNNGDVHYWLGLAYLKLKFVNLARQEFARSVLLGRGSDNAKEANNYLLSLTSSKTAGDAPASGTPAAPSVSAPDITSGKPTVVAFFAAWCEQSDKLDNWFDQARATFGDQLQLQKVDVEDPANHQLVQRFKVGPVPTLVFLAANGNVSSSIVGQTSFVNIAEAISNISSPIVPKAAAPGGAKLKRVVRPH
jgi:alpha-beta hydrolase superfamily lysophospholipase/thioredoxin-like negative regulator of GroEL